MEKINNEVQTKNNQVHRLVIFGVAVLIGLLIVGGGLYYIFKISSPVQPDGQPVVSTPAQAQPDSISVTGDSLSESTSTQSAMANDIASSSEQSAQDLTGKWAGKYKITAPKECAGVAGSWTADVNQSGDSFSGSYKSDVVKGVVSGNSSGANDFNWTVTGNGIIQLKGNVTSQNAVAGNFTGPICPSTSQKTIGTFSGGR